MIVTVQIESNVLAATSKPEPLLTLDKPSPAKLTPCVALSDLNRLFRFTPIQTKKLGVQSRELTGRIHKENRYSILSKEKPGSRMLS